MNIRTSLRARPSTWLLIISSVLVAGIQAFPNTDSVYSPRPYTVNVSTNLVEETRLKASFFRPSLDIDEPAWTDGPPTSEITTIAKYWVEDYSWSDVQAEINANFSHYVTTVPPPGGDYNRPLDIHFIHQRSARADAIPMLMLHGWPSTSLEWEKVIPGLVDPADESDPAFHIVAPDLPGYGFSPAPTTPGLGPSEHAAVFASLMQQLDYKHYAVYSTDLGFIVALAMLADYESRIINHVTDFYFVLPNSTDTKRYEANKTTPEETKYIAAVNTFFTEHSAYAEIHSTLPLSIADALNDSPVGFLAWMYQLVYTVSDKAYTASQLITEALVLYLPGVYGNIRSYKELYPTLTLLANGEVKTTNVPTSALQFGGVTSYHGFSHLTFVPKTWIERTANVTYFARHDVGGHFPALSEPSLLLEEIRAIFAYLVSAR